MLGSVSQWMDGWMNGVLGHFYALSRLNWAEFLNGRVVRIKNYFISVYRRVWKGGKNLKQLRVCSHSPMPYIVVTTVVTNILSITSDSVNRDRYDA